MKGRGKVAAKNSSGPQGAKWNVGPPESGQLPARTPPVPTVSVMVGPVSGQSREFSDEVFHECLTKAADRIDQMAARARQDHREGKTRPFPQ